MILIQKNNKGFTLIETMVAIVISALVIAAASATYVAQSRSYSAQESVSEVTTQTKMAHDLITRTLREAPFGFDPTDPSLTDPIILPGVLNGVSSLDIITPTDHTATASGRDAITIQTALYIGEVWPVGATWPAGGTPGNRACGGLNPQQSPTGSVVTFRPIGSVLPSANSYVLIDGRDFKEVASFTFPNITFTSPLGMSHPLEDTTLDNICDRGRSLHLLIDTTFCVDSANNLRRIRINSNPALCTSPAGPGNFNEIIAENIEDLQFAYALDVNGDFIIDGAQLDMLDNPDFAPNPLPANFDRIKAVRINILARSDRPDVNYTGLGNQPAIIENRALGAAGDNFKRRWFRSIVMIRNLEGV